MQKFELKRIAEICPDTGETLGAALAKAAGEMSPLSSTKAQVYYLAAEAYEQASSASIGHSRSARYDERAKELRGFGQIIEDAVKKEHDDAESARLLECFQAGYTGQDISRYSFERREAALVGRLFAESKTPAPTRINKVYQPRPLGRDSTPDHLLVDDMKFIVIYPQGKIAEAFAKPIA